MGDDNPGVFLINVKAYVAAGWFLMLAVLYEVCATIFANKNLKISNDRAGLTRSAILLVLFIVIHAVGNLHSWVLMTSTAMATSTSVFIGPASACRPTLLRSTSCSVCSFTFLLDSSDLGTRRAWRRLRAFGTL